MRLSLLILPSLVIISLFYHSPVQVSAYQVGGLDNTAIGSGYSTEKKPSDVPVIVGVFINAVLDLLGVVFIALVMWGAFDIVGAGNNVELVKKAKGRIKNGAIGILIVLLSFFLAKAFVGFVSQGVFNTGT